MAELARESACGGHPPRPSGWHVPAPPARARHPPERSEWARRPRLRGGVTGEVRVAEGTRECVAAAAAAGDQATAGAMPPTCRPNCRHALPGCSAVFTASGRPASHQARQTCGPPAPSACAPLWQARIPAALATAQHIRQQAPNVAHKHAYGGACCRAQAAGPERRTLARARQAAGRSGAQLPQAGS